MTSQRARKDAAMDRAIIALERALAQRRADEIATSCPKAEAIMAANTPDPMHSGVVGAMQLFGGLSDPSMYKRKAAEAILSVRRNRLALKNTGRNWRGADAVILDKAAYYRRGARGAALSVRADAELHRLVRGEVG